MIHKIREFLEKNYTNIDISRVSTADLVISYYETCGMSPDTTTRDWLVGIAEKKYPPFTEAYKTITVLRKQNNLWLKKH